MIPYGFYDWEPPEQVKAQEQAEHNQRLQAIANEKRAVLVRGLSTPEAIAALAIVREMAQLKGIRPLDMPDTGQANRLLWWREGRTDLIDEIEAILKKETNR